MIEIGLDRGGNRMQAARRSIPPGVWKLVKGLVSVGLLAWLVLRFDWMAVLGTLSAVSAPVAGLGFILMILAQMLGARRLQLLLAAQQIRVSYFYVLRLTFVGLFAGNFLPSTVGGDAVKVLALVRAGYGKGAPAACVVLDRLVNMAAVLSLSPTVLVAPRLLEPGLATTVRWSVAGLAAGGVVLAGLLVVARQPLLRWLKATDPTPSQDSRWHRLLNSLVAIGARWAAKPRLLVVTFVLSWAAVLLGSNAGWVIARGLGMSIGIVEWTAVVVLVYLVTLPPVSLNGLGVQEVSLVYLLSRLGATPGQALAMAVFSRLLQVGTSLLGAFDTLSWRVWDRKGD
jgi:uncharacterized membrane protein YbhN (UPF0104 family)